MKSIKVLVSEDVEADFELEIHALKKAGLAIDAIRVESEMAFRHQLDIFSPDLVISDYSLPGFDGLSALAIAREKMPDMPFIFVSGTIGEQRAIESYKRGASDYVVKSDLSRLAPVVQRVMSEVQQRKIRHQAEFSVLESEEKFRAIIETTQEWIWETNKEGVCTFSSPFVHTLLGYYAEEMIGKQRLIYLHPDDLPRIESLLADNTKTNRGWRDLVSCWRRKDGSIRWLESNGIPLLDEQNRVFGYRGTERDVTERIWHQEKIERLSRIHEVLSETNATIVRVQDRLELFRRVCRIAVEQGKLAMAWIGIPGPNGEIVKPVAWTGLEQSYLDEVGASLSKNRGSVGATQLALQQKQAIIVNDIATDPRIVFKTAALARGYKSMLVLPLVIQEKVVAVMTLYATQCNFFDEQELKLLTNLAGDISFALNHFEKEERFTYLSYHDLVTGLANRTLFLDRANQLIQIASQEAGEIAILLIDVERFRHINESFGRRGGDELLVQIAQRLSGILPEGATLARIGADHFAFAIPNVKEEVNVATFIEQHILKLFLEPLTIEGNELRVAVRCGIAIYPNDAKDVEALTMNAETALTKAKALGDKYLFYAAPMHTRVAERLTLENKLRRAVEEEQFILHYQPKLNLKTQRVTGMEALIRWQSPEMGLVPPGKFIPILEETGLILDVGKWVLEKAIADCALLRLKNIAPLRIAVNISALQLRQKDFVEAISNMLCGDVAQYIELEVTESLLVENIESAIEKLNRIKAIGASVALDDFGTGFSSLNYLVQLPVDLLKIDRSFIVNMTTNASSRAVVSAVITLAHALNLKVVAEGVELQEQANLLKLMRCDEIQGYFLSRPVPLPEIEMKLITRDLENRNIGIESD